MTNELTGSAPPTMNFKVVAPPERKYWVWSLFSLSTDMDLEGRVR